MQQQYKRSILLLLPVLICSFTLHAQKPVVKNDPNHDKQPMHFGYSLGVNFMDAYVYRYETAEIEEISPGFNVQIISNFRITNGFDFRVLPGLAFGQRRLVIREFSLPQDGMPEEAQYAVEDDTSSNLILNLESAYFEVPLLIKYKTDRINNFRPYVIGGFNPRVDLAGIQKNLFGNDSDENTPDSSTGGSTDLINRVVPAYEIGFGVDFYMVYFKLGIELKYSRSMFDDVNRTGDFSPLFSEINKLESSVFFISFHFE